MADIYYVADRKSITSKKGIQGEGTDVTGLLEDKQKKRLIELGAITNAKPDCVKRLEEQQKQLAAKQSAASTKSKTVTPAA